MWSVPYLRRVLGIALSAVILALSAQAQTLPVSLELASANEEMEGRFGYTVSGAGDVDNDGFDDILIGAFGEGPGSSPDNAGRAYVFSGATGAVLYTLASPNEEMDSRFGWSVSDAGDANNDGFADVIVGAYLESPGSSPSNAGRAYIFSGATGTVLRTLASPNEESSGFFGWSVSGAGDVNGDSFADVIVGALDEDPGSSPSNAGRAYIFSGATGTVLYTLVSPNEENGGNFGRSVSGAGDVNRDDVPDVIVGANFEDPGTSPELAGRAYIFSGATGTVLYTLISPTEELIGQFGFSVAGAGDVNGDQFADVIVGASEEDPGTSPDFAGRAHVFSGNGGGLLYTLSSPNEEAGSVFGRSVSGAGDVNGDGFDDVVVGARGEDPGASPDAAGRTYVFSGVDGVLLHTLASPNEEEFGNLGFSVSGAGDVNGDGRADVVAGAYREDPGVSPDNAGRAYVFSAPTPITLSGPEGWTTVAAPRDGSRRDFFEPIWTQGTRGSDVLDGDPSIFTYNEAISADRNTGYVAADLTIVTPGQGYLVYVFEDDFLPEPGIQGSFPKTLNAVGLDLSAVAFPADFAFPVTFTDTRRPTEDGWNLIGNPFAAGLDWDAPGWTKTSVSNILYVYDPLAATYRTWNGSLGSFGTGVLAAGQAAWVKGDFTDMDLAVATSAQVPEGGTLYAREGDPGAAPLALGFEVAGTVGTLARTDAAFVHFDEAALTGADPLDAYELAPFASTYLSLFAEDAAGTLRDILALPADGNAPLGASIEVPLGVWAVAEGQFTSADLTLSWPTLTLPDGWTAMLLDTATGTKVDLLAASDYRFTATPGAQGAEAPDVLRGRTAREAPPVPTPLALDGIAAEGRRAAQRFVVTVSASGVDAEDGSTPLAFALDAAYPNPFTVQTTVAYTLAEAGDVRLTVYDALGRE
ncbi:MAG: integrin alpha, partial [Bacteroidota bacterium]